MVDDEFSVEIDGVEEKPIPPPTPPPPVPFVEDVVAFEADPDEEPPEPQGHALSREVADWMVRGGQEFFHGVLPPDIAAIWSHPPMRVGDEATARVLIAAWGMDEFRCSALHTTALAERARLARSGVVEARFKAERKRKKGQA